MTLLSLEGPPTSLFVVGGVICHILFNRLEPQSLPVIFFLLLGPPTALAVLLRLSLNTNLAALLVSYPLYIGTLLFSVVAYRLSPFHPLASFPGPIVCKITRFWALYIVRTGNQHRYYKELHAQYGTHVRTGPNHLHVCDADAIPTVLGTRGFPRGGRYQVTVRPGAKGSLLSLVDPQEHAQRRRVWDRGLNTSAVQGYQEILTRRITQLVSALERQQGIVDLSLWFSCFSFDFMGELAFGGAFKLMEQGCDADGYMRLARLGVLHQETVGTIPWIKPFHGWLPSSKDIGRLHLFAMNSVLSRKAQGTVKRDIFYHLLDEEDVGSGPPALPTLIGESTLAIVAGSDTSGAALSNIFFYLISNPWALTRLQDEVDEIFPSGSEAASPGLFGEMKFLNAVINETLRLQPAVPNGVQRVVPSGSSSAVISGRLVPGSTTVQVSTYSVHRDNRYFSPDPNGFRPERWLEPQQADFKLDQSAYFPFSYGPMNCPGKNLALQQLRMVTCSLLQRFEFKFAAGWDEREWENSLSDCYILTKGVMPVLIKMRK